MVPALSPFSTAICTGSAAGTLRVRLLSTAQQKQAPTIANAPHDRAMDPPWLRESSTPPATIAIRPLVRWPRTGRMPAERSERPRKGS
jgi:hypothetical protein